MKQMSFAILESADCDIFTKIYILLIKMKTKDRVPAHIITWNSDPYVLAPCLTMFADGLSSDGAIPSDDLQEHCDD